MPAKPGLFSMMIGWPSCREASSESLRRCVSVDPPAGTPREIVNRLAAEIGRIVATTEITGRFEQIGIEPVVSTPEQSAKFLDDEIAKWAKVITTANVKPEQ